MDIKVADRVNAIGSYAFADVENIVTKLKNEIIRLDASPKISLFFGMSPETNQPVYTKKTDKKGSFKEEITGVLSDKHEIRVFTGQMSKICSIKPPEP